jgi:hypothetical protein
MIDKPVIDKRADKVPKNIVIQIKDYSQTFRLSFEKFLSQAVVHFNIPVG